MSEEINEKQVPVKEEQAKFKGKYIEAIGRRKSAIARVRLFKNGNGTVMVNSQKITEYFSNDKSVVAKNPLKLTGHLRDLNFMVMVKGGGKMGQAEAIQHGISRTLVEFEKELKPALKSKGLMTRDSRIKERKKPGLKKARKRPQWAKR